MRADVPTSVIGPRSSSALRRWRVDLVHMHGLDFHAYLPPAGPPVLATLHLPPDWYPPEVFEPGAAGDPAALRLRLPARPLPAWGAAAARCPERRRRRRARGAPRQAPLRARPRPHLPRERLPHRAGRGQARGHGAPARWRGVRLPGARGVLRARDRAASRYAPALPRADRLRPQAAPAHRGALPARAQPRARDQLAGRDGSARLRHAGGRIPGGRPARGRRARQDRVPGARRARDGRGDACRR